MRPTRASEVRPPETPGTSRCQANPSAGAPSPPESRRRRVPLVGWGPSREQEPLWHPLRICCLGEIPSSSVSPAAQRRPVVPSSPTRVRGARGGPPGVGGRRSPPGRELIRRRRRPEAPGRDLAWAPALGSSGEEPGGCSWRRPAPGGRRSCVPRPGWRGPLDSVPPRSPYGSRLAAPEPSGLCLLGLSVFSRPPREEGALSLAGRELQRQRGARPRGGERRGSRVGSGLAVTRGAASPPICGR